MTEILPNIIAIGVPEDITAVQLYGYGEHADEIKGLIFKVVNDKPVTTRWGIKIPPGNYTFLFTTLGVSEEQAASVVECTQPAVRGSTIQMAFYKNYEQQFSSFGGAVPSLHSLLRSKGLNGNNYALIQKNDL